MKIGKAILIAALLSGLAGCGPTDKDAGEALNTVAEGYVKLVLAVGGHDDGYVDAYYGPEAWAQEAGDTARSLDELAVTTGELRDGIAAIDLAGTDELLRARGRFLDKQLIAVAARIAMLGGESLSFDEETQALYDAVSPGVTEAELDAVLAEIDALIPGDGPLAERFIAFRNQFIIPPERVDEVFQAAIAACRERTGRYLTLPEGESFTTSYVTGKSWSAYNWYQGNAFSLIEVNTDLPIFIDRAVDLGCHEGYPGHHVFNALLERRFVRQLGWMEYSVYPLYSPQSLLAEGTANYGIEMAFPGEERLDFERDVLYPIAGIDPALAAGLAEARELLRKMRYARTEGARRYLDGGISREEAVEWAARYGLISDARAEQTVRFTEQYRGYVINYTLGEDLARAYVERHAGDDAASRWAAYEVLLSTPLTASALGGLETAETEGETDIDALVERALAAFDIPGIALGIIKDGEVLHAKGYGILKLGAPGKVDADTFFQIASNTKSMTVAALAILMDEGKLTWDDKVTGHIAEFRMFEPYVTREFTIRDLLTHRSGLPLGAGDLLFWPDGNTNIDDILNALQYLKPATSFRSTYAYDNLLYQVAGEVVTRASGMPYRDFVEQRIFAPLGMNDCVVSHGRVPEGAKSAQPHAMVDGTLSPVAFFDESGVSLAAAGGVNCTINSMLKWVDMQLRHGVMENGERLFSADRHGEMWTPVTIIGAQAPTEPGEKVAVRLYALGWGISETMGHQTVSHTGGLPGMLTSMVLIPEENLGILVFTNQQNGAARGAIISELLSGYLDRDEEQDFEARVDASRSRGDDALEKMAGLWAARDADKPPSLPLSDFAQEYSDNWYGDVSIELAGDALRFVSHRSENLVGTLRHFEGDTFVVEWDDRGYVADAYLTFELTEGGDVERIVMAKFDPRTDFSFDFWDLDLRPKE